MEEERIVQDEISLNVQTHKKQEEILNPLFTEDEEFIEDLATSVENEAKLQDEKSLDNTNNKKPTSKVKKAWMVGKLKERAKNQK